MAQAAAAAASKHRYTACETFAVVLGPKHYASHPAGAGAAHAGRQWDQIAADSCDRPSEPVVAHELDLQAQVGPANPAVLAHAMLGNANADPFGIFDGAAPVAVDFGCRGTGFEGAAR